MANMFKYIVVVLLSIGQISGQCTFPQSWIDRGRTFIDMDLGGYIIMTRLLSNGLVIDGWTGSSVIPLATTCHEARKVGDNLQFAWEETFLLQQKLCITVVPGDNDKTLFFQENLRTTATSLADCQDPYDQYRVGIPVDSSLTIPGATKAQIFTTFQTLASGASTPLRDATVQAEVEDLSGRACVGDSASTVTISGNKMTLSLCKSEYNMELTWVDSFDPTGSDVDGSIVALMDLSDDGTSDPPYKIFCARYKQDGDAVTMSVEIGDLTSGICPGSMKYNTVDATTFSFNFILPPAPPTTTTTTTEATVESGSVTYSPGFLLSVLSGLLVLALH